MTTEAITADRPAARQPKRRRTPVWLEFLSSMPLAITLLVVVAITSIIGTVLQQNQPYNDYIIKFGPFWFEFFRTLQLYDVYHAVWFLVILAFLVVSTSVCVYRNTPSMLREMRDWRADMQKRTLQRMQHRGESGAALAPEQVLQRAGLVLRAAGYRVRTHVRDAQHLLTAKRGSGNRLGYIFAHLSVVIVGVGGLLDGNIPLLVQEWRGAIKVETRNLPVSEVPAQSVLDANNPSFRGRVSIPEGTKAGFLFLNIRDGYLVQRLPFEVEVKDFRIEHYDTGQPKSFETDLVVYDKDLKEPIRQTIAVNHPLSYKGVTIYQASFEDGGSRLTTRAWPLSGELSEPVTITGAVRGGAAEIELHGKPYKLEFVEFKKFNVVDRAENKKKPDFKNLGPSMQYKLRAPDGRAVEFMNYMSPVPVDGRLFMLSGTRNAVSEEFRFLHLPVDKDGSLQRFTTLVSMLHDPARRLLVADQIADASLAARGESDPDVRNKLIERTQLLFQLFAERGLDGVSELIEKQVPEAERKRVAEAYFNVVRLGVGTLYRDILVNEGVDVEKGLSEADNLFFDDAFTAMLALANYESPFYLQLTEFQHVQASGLEMTRSPGKSIVYLGCTGLIIGVFMLFYLRQRRVWVLAERASDDGEDSNVWLAAVDTRNSPEFGEEFAQLQGNIDKALRA